MPRCVTAAQIQELDRRAIEDCGIPSVVLMENAGRAVADAALKLLSSKPRPRIGVVCGGGNNGGDGFVAARHLLNSGARVEIFLAGSTQKLKPDAFLNYSILKRCGFPVRELAVWGRASERILSRSDLIVDALFGVGLDRELCRPFSEIIDGLNALGVPLLSVDVPSGLDATTGKVWGRAVRAQATVTFTLPKKGFMKGLGPSLCGQVIVADIGIPTTLVKNILK